MRTTLSRTLWCQLRHGWVEVEVWQRGSECRGWVKVGSKVAKLFAIGESGNVGTGTAEASSLKLVLDGIIGFHTASCDTNCETVGHGLGS